ncbi:MAG: O-antigen ligase family protein [Bacteroidales bacterium]|jgi:O-antigen ligase|nr:O-antigen ligase family protein [Bacteroidales bacterium]
MIASEQKIIGSSEGKCRRHFEYIIPILSIALFLATLPLKTNYNTWAMVIMLVAMLIAFIIHKPRTFRWQPVFYALCAFFFIKIIGYFYTEDPYLAQKRLDNGIQLVLFPIIFSMVQFSKENVTLLLRFFVWVVIAFCGFGLLSYAAIVPGPDWDMVWNGKLYAPLLTMWPAHWHPSFDSTIVLMAVPISLSLPQPLRRRGVRYFGEWLFRILGVTLPTAFTVLSGARVGIVAIPLLLALAYLFYCRFKPLFKWGLAVAGVLAAVFIVHQFPQADDKFEDPIRKNMRAMAIDAIKEKPLFGWGTGYVAPLIQSEERAQRVGLETPYEFGQFHNQYLEEVVQFGIPGALVLLLLIGWLLYLGVRKKDFLLLSLLLIYLMFFWTETVLETFKGITPFAFWVCFLAGTQGERLDNSDTVVIQ